MLRDIAAHHRELRRRTLPTQSCYVGIGGIAKSQLPRLKRTRCDAVSAISSRTIPRRRLGLRRGIQALRRRRSVKPGGDAAYDDGTGAAERRTVRPGDVSVSCQLQNAELLVQETSKALLDCVCGPLVEVSVPDWAVISSGRRNAAKRIVRPMPVRQRGEQALT